MSRPPSLLTPQIVPSPLHLHSQGSRGVYVRAYRASFPPHAPDMLTVWIQAIDDTGTCTLSDFQPCRLLTFLFDMPSSATPGSSDIHKFLSRNVNIAFAVRSAARHSRRPGNPLHWEKPFRGFLLHTFGTACQFARPLNGPDPIAPANGGWSPAAP
jgi:hypothetical protein